jgi:hypothetical protein
MKRKIWTIVSMALLSGAFVACSDDNDFDPNGNQTGTEDAGYSSYLTINVSMSESGSTRATTDDATSSATDAEGDITLAGTAEERAIKVVNVYVFKETTSGSTTSWTLTENRAITAFTDGVEGSNVYRYGTVTFKALLKNETYRLYAVVNGKAVDESGNAWNTTTTEADFLAKSRFVSVSANGISTDNQVKEPASSAAPRTRADETGVVPEDFSMTSDGGLRTSFTNGFVMASRQFDDMEGTTAQNYAHPYVEFRIEDDNSENNPALVTVAVERVMARLDLGRSANYDGVLYVPTASGSDSENKYVTVNLVGYYPVNISQQSYLFRHRSQDPLATSPVYTYDNLDYTKYTYGQKSGDDQSYEWKTADYVVDPFTSKKIGSYSAGTTQSLPTGYYSMYYNPLHGTTDVKVTSRTMIDIPSSLSTIGYCLENTTTAENQQKEFSTGLVLSATFEPEASHIYYDYKNKAYTYEGLQTYATTGSKPTDYTASTTADASTTTSTIVADAVKSAETAVTNAKSAVDAIATVYTAATNTTSGNETVAAAILPYKTAADEAYQTATTAQTSMTSATTDADKAKYAAEVATAVLTAAQNVSSAAKAAAYKSGETESTFDTNSSAATAASTAETSAKTAQALAEYASANVALDAVSVTDGAYTGDTLYYYNYNFYTSIFALRDVMVLPTLNTYSNDKETIGSTGKSNIQILSEYGVTTYVRDNNASSKTKGKFVTYYHYLIKHYQATIAGNADAQYMAPMKYAIVRNNVYQMTVSGVLALGSSSPDPTDPDPEDSYYPGPNPDDEQEVYLKMELQVRHWVVRDQGDIKLK